MSNLQEHDLDSANAVLAVPSAAELGGSGDEGLRRIAGDFVSSIRTCTRLSGDGARGHSVAGGAEYRAASDRRLAALERLYATPAAGPPGLKAKFEALLAMLDWLDFEDPRFGRFALHVAREQQEYLVRHSVGPARLSLSRWLGGSIGWARR